MASGAPLLVLKDVEKTFTLRKSGWFSGERRIVRALDRVSLTVRRGECLGLVGESGSGKTTTAKAILRGIDIDGGTIAYDRGHGMEDVAGLSGEDLMDYRRRVPAHLPGPVFLSEPAHDGQRMPVGAAVDPSRRRAG